MKKLNRALLISFLFTFVFLSINLSIKFSAPTDSKFFINPAENNSKFTTCSNIFVWKYKYKNKKYRKRKYNVTKKKWVSSWILV